MLTTLVGRIAGSLACCSSIHFLVSKSPQEMILQLLFLSPLRHPAFGMINPSCSGVDTKKSTSAADLGKNYSKGVKHGSWTPFTITLSRTLDIHSSSSFRFMTGVNPTNSRIMYSLSRTRLCPQEFSLGRGMRN